MNAFLKTFRDVLSSIILAIFNESIRMYFDLLLLDGGGGGGGGAN